FGNYSNYLYPREERKVNSEIMTNHAVKLLLLLTCIQHRQQNPIYDILNAHKKVVTAADLFQYKQYIADNFDTLLEIAENNTSLIADVKSKLSEEKEEIRLRIAAAETNAIILSR
ncbi:MAG: hypothetical protein AAF195_04100, partial [Pseudomonadota bacterium]